MMKPSDTVEEPVNRGIDDSPLSVAIELRRKDAISLVTQALNNQTVSLVFQPVMRADRMEAPAFYEGLVRVKDETGGLVPARDFINQIETLELGRQIDCASLELGLRALAQTPDLRLAINMSARSIGYSKWNAILNYGLAQDPTLAERLILEITERSAMLMPDLVTSFMRELQQKGITFALDDFGAGQTSLRYFRDFMFDILKIDGEFIQGIASDGDNQVLTAAMISIAKHFDMFTVAESVETAQDAETLKALGIDCVQGFYLGAPTATPPWAQTSMHKQHA